MTGIDFRTHREFKRGWRNNNPMNIRYVAENKWKGKVKAVQRKDSAFEEFTNCIWGWRAAFYLLMKYFFKNKLKTPRMIISRWAPATENNTDAYVKNVMDFLHKKGYRYLEENATLPIPERNLHLWQQLMKAMTVQESGWMPADSPEHELMGFYIEDAINEVLKLKEIKKLNDANK